MIKRKAYLKKSTKPIRRRRKPKAHEIGQAVKKFTDGREICLPTSEGDAEYARRRGDMTLRQGCICAACGLPLRDDTTFDHEDGRATRRTDAIWSVDGTPVNASLHLRCNGARGSTREPYKYQTTLTREKFERVYYGIIMADPIGSANSSGVIDLCTVEQHGQHTSTTCFPVERSTSRKIIGEFTT